MTHRTLHATGLLLFSASLALLHAGVVRAEDAPKVDALKPASTEPAKTESQIKAGALFSEARQLVDAGKYNQACPKFEESLSLNVGIGVQFNLADCWEHIGRTASARSLFQGVAASARALGQAARADVAQARADALEPRLVRMLIDVRATEAGLVIRRNQIALERKDFGTASPIDAGEYLIEASAPGKKTWQARVIVPVMASEVVAVTIPRLEDDAAAPVAPLAASAEPVPERPVKAAVLAPLPPPVEQGNPKDRRRTAYALTFAGLGVASLGLGTVMALEFKSKNDDAKQICPSGTGCSQNDVNQHGQLVSDAKTFRTWSFVGFGVGSAALVAATVLYFAPSSSERASAFSAAPFMTADGSWGAFASGKF
ncbi:MAG: hypothetical protein ABW061_08650 [Polyangiaceae bacterium]